MSILHKALVAELRSNTITGSILIEDDSLIRCYPLVIPQKRPNGPAQIPAVVYATAGVERQVTQCGTNPVVRSILTLDCYAATYDQARELANAVRTVLVDFRGLLGAIVEVRAANLQSEFDLSDIEPGLYRVSQTWAIWHLE